ncbi:hypothetical protein [Candidatus Clavichlamydia salmonicola]|uniref:hypothetical protein n=1 Tax=Candidatus Clavichlamydia salmonicola TaxID=469812 RepID=UPI001890CDCF|nr:hypothetical protein [Candidatus Clavichlamydia salmonicola]
MISNRVKLPFCFKQPSSLSEACYNIKNNLCSMAGLPKLILSGVLSYVVYLDASYCFYSEYLMDPQRVEECDSVTICCIQKNNQTFLVDTLETFFDRSSYFTQIEPVIIGAGSAMLMVVGISQFFLQRKKVDQLFGRKRLLDQNFLLNKVLEKAFKREDYCLDWVKLVEAVVELSAGLTLGISAWTPLLCTYAHKKFSKMHCVNFSEIMYLSSILYLTQAGFLLFLKAYGPSKKEKILQKLEQRYGAIGIIRKTDLPYLDMPGVKAIINEEQDNDDEWEEVSLEDEYANTKEWNIDVDQPEEVSDLAEDNFLQIDFVNNQHLDKRKYPLATDAFFDEGPFMFKKENNQLERVNISTSIATKLQRMHIPCVVLGEDVIEFSGIRKLLENDFKGLCISIEEKIIKIVSKNSFKAKRNL